ncbi:MAG: CvpA family protein, partial [Bacteroidales bacterium]|nr:CvpA family protein [Bacteroidales bacterium]
MNYIDLILLIFAAWLGYQGFRKGLIIEVASLAALILGIYAGIHFSGYAEQFIRNNFEIKEDYIPVAAFTSTFIVVVILVFL